MNYNDMLLNLTKTADSIKIPNIMNADEISLNKAREQKTAVVKEIARIRKLMKEDSVTQNKCTKRLHNYSFFIKCTCGFEASIEGWYWSRFKLCPGCGTTCEEAEE